MALDSHFIPAFSIETVILDKDTGAPLSGGKVYFEEDNQRGTLKAVYQITGNSPNYVFTQLPNPMILSSIGTFEDSLSNPTVPYFFPYDSNLDVDLYYIRVTSSEDVDQFDRQAVPFIEGGGDSSVSTSFVNELSNPQFAVVNFDTDAASYTYSFNAVSLEVVHIAPDWEIEVSCSAAGTVTVSQSTPIGSLNRITNPGTLLNISSTGLSRLRLRQRLYGSPNLWGSGYLAGTFVAKTYSGSDTILNMYYSQSSGVIVDLPIVSATLSSTGNYNEYSSNVLIPPSGSTAQFPLAYVDIEFAIPLNTEIDITSVMVAGTAEESISNIVYDQTTYARQVDQLFHNYKYPLIFKPIPSYLVGWDFPLNPCQALGLNVAPQATGANTSYYAADQTILFQTQNSSLTVQFDSVHGMYVSPANATSFSVIQYIETDTAADIIQYGMSMAIGGYVSAVGGSSITGNLRMYWTQGSLPNINANASLVTSITNGIPTVSGGWAQIERTTPQEASFTFTATGELTQQHMFSGFNATQQANIQDVTYIAVVATFVTTTPANEIALNYISLCKGDIATVPAAKSFSETLLDCQYFYETSYPILSIPGSFPTTGTVVVQKTTPVGENPAKLIPSYFSVPFVTAKFAAPAMTLYSTSSATPNLLLGIMSQNGANFVTQEIAITNWTATGITTKCATYMPNTATGFVSTGNATIDSTQGYIEFQYVADSRLGTF